MDRKLFISVVPLLAVVALAMTPVAAQAKQCTTGSKVEGPCPHWLVGGKQGTGPISVSLWGTLSVPSEGGTITCENAAIGDVSNPAVVKPATDGASGEDSLFFSSGFCVEGACPGVAYEQAVGQPWPSELVENANHEVQDNIHGMKLIIGCENPLEKGSGPGFSPNGGKLIGETTELETTATDRLAPLFASGTSGCNKPSLLEFVAPENKLVGLGGALNAKVEGAFKICGYEKSQLVTTTID